MSGEAVEPFLNPYAETITDELNSAGFVEPVIVGRGGFGVVYRCRQPALDRVVAVKVIGSGLERGDRVRFLREQQAMGRLSGHPNIVPVFEAGVTGTGRPYIVMPFHHRDSLDVWITNSGPRSVTEVLDIGIKLAGAVETAHHAGILHRDIKPANVLLSEYGEPQLTDFGIARLTDRQDTTSGLLIGSPAYTAPELLRGSQPSAASDIYALGATLFTALAGRPAFGRCQSEELMAQLRRIDADPIPDLRAFGVPDGIWEVIARSMARSPADRFDSASALGEALRTAGAQLGYLVAELPVPGEWKEQNRPVREDPEAVHTAAYVHAGPPAEISVPVRPPTVATKYRPPVVTHPMVARTRLLDRLTTSSRPRLILIHGPAGYGKTTVAIQYLHILEREEGKTAWLSIDEDDNNPAWFLAHLVDAITVALPQLGTELIRILDGHGSDAERFVLTTLLNRTHAIARPIAIVLDDWHRVSNAASRSIARFLLEHGCHHLQLVITSRTRQGLPLSSLRVHNELVELDASALRFDVEESRELLTTTTGLVLEDNDIVGLKQSTDGWVAALQLASISLREHRNPRVVLSQLTGRHRALGEYLAENVLDNLEPNLFNFLLATAISERTCASLAIALTAREDAQAVLEDIEDKDLFLTRLDEDGKWFRYHPLFTEYLRRRLGRDDPNKLRELHRTAARWFAEQRLLSTAIDHFHAAGDDAAAIEVIEQAAIPLLEQSKMNTLLGLVTKLPAMASVGRPRLQLAVAWAHALLHHRTAAAEALTHLTAALPIPTSEAELDLLAEAALIRATITVFDDQLDLLDEALETCMARADRLRPWILCGIADVASFEKIHHFEFGEARRWQRWARPHHRRASGPFSVIYGYCLDAVAAREQLDLDAAETSLRHAMHLATTSEEDNFYSSRLTGALLGELLYERGELAEAEALLDESYRLGAEGGIVEFMLATYVIGARLKHHLGQREQAADRLSEGTRLARSLRLPRLGAYITNERIRTGIGCAPVPLPDLASEFPREFPEGIAQISAEVMEETTIRLMLAADDEDARINAGVRAHALSDSIDAVQRPRASLHARVLLTECLTATGAHTEAEQVLLPVLAQCAHHRVPQLVLDAGPAVRTLAGNIRTSTPNLDLELTVFLDHLQIDQQP
ncbi:serine/threonine-protein kinase [Rhodococcus pyridinivorans]|uniref:serine/threonine-protein kinase n=1 Tax=Rhodococcus pyridinivorans TaxID=103816 RepID=UPI000A638988|nr:serine/threonine-protein kinase [Rhodococcus pyridinivorans]